MIDVDGLFPDSMRDDLKLELILKALELLKVRKEIILCHLCSEQARSVIAKDQYSHFSVSQHMHKITNQ